MFDLGIVFVSDHWVYVRGPQGWLFRAVWFKDRLDPSLWRAHEDPFLSRWLSPEFMDLVL